MKSLKYVEVGTAYEFVWGDVTLVGIAKKKDQTNLTVGMQIHYRTGPGPTLWVPFKDLGKKVPRDTRNHKRATA